MTEEYQAQSLLSWFVSALGPLYLILLPLAGLVCFALTLMLVIRGKGPSVAAAVVLVVPIPLLVGVFGAFHGGIPVFSVVAQSGGTIRPVDVAVAVSAILVAPFFGMLMMFPSYVVAVLGATLRCFASPDRA